MPHRPSLRVGVFGNSTGLTDATCSTDCWAGGCSPSAQLCAAGYYCPQGSVTATQVECGGAGRLTYMQPLLTKPY
jgi:hypothetical protein